MLSVIVPVFNVENYIFNTLVSLSEQNYQDVEFLLIDDGSEDKSGLICDQFCKGKAIFRVFHKKNGGVSSARNLGLSLARGDYISFVDADDLIDPNIFSVLINEAERGDYDIVQCAFLDGKESKTENNCLKDDLPLNGGVDGCRYIFEPNKLIFNSVCGKVFRKHLIDDLRFDETISIGEDLKFTFEAVLRSKSIKLLRYAGYLYTKREGSTMESKFTLKRFDDFLINDWMLGITSDDNEIKKRILTRDATNAVECYYSLVCESSPDKSKQSFLVSRLKNDKIRYPLSKKYELIIWFLLHARSFINPFLRMHYRRQRKKQDV